MNEPKTATEATTDKTNDGGAVVGSTAGSVIRPTDEEIDLEARQWAEEYATKCENTQTTRQAIFAQGARWARSVAQYSTPNAKVSLRGMKGTKP